MEIYTTDEEQVETIKKYVKEYAPTVIISLLIVITATFGFRYWRGEQEQSLVMASSGYEQMLVSDAGGDKDATRLHAENLINHYPKSPYAKLSALLLAKLQIAAGHYNKAEVQLQWVIAHGKNPAIRQIARNRKARILIAQKKPKSAIATLTKVDDSSYKPAIEAIRGDAWLALGNKDAARNAYKNALQSLPTKKVDWPILQMKLNELAQHDTKKGIAQ